MSYDTDDVQHYVSNTYNHAITCYDYETFVRVTNGSAGFYADVHLEGDELKVDGERYGESFQKTGYDRGNDGLADALADSLGL